MADAETKDQEIDYLSMSDEEIANMAGPEDAAAGGAGAIEDQGTDPTQGDGSSDAGTDTDDQTGKDGTNDAETDDDADGASQAAEEAGEGKDEEKSSETDEADDEQAKDEGTEVADTKAKTEEKKTSDQAAIDYKAEYERLLAPFKANGRDIAVKNIDEAITLMQMGANYNKKMAALKPNLKLMKLLENSNLLSEEKIGFLIDLEKKNPAAISKLIKDSGLDPLELDADKASAYRQTAYTVDDREIELDTVLEEVQASPTYTRLLDIVGTKWDAASKQVIAGSPQILKVINEHLAAGIYDVISKEVDNERMFGRLTGLSDIEAYKRIGDQLHARGAFNHLAQGSSQNQGQQQARGAVVNPKPKVDEDKLKEKRRAASSTKPASSGNAASKDFDPLAMSDEEFGKLVNKQFL